MDAIILAGGQGSRMEDILPKPLVIVQNKAILSYQLDYFLKSKIIDKIVIALGYRAEEIREFVKEKYPQANIDFSIETEPLGTAGAFKQALAKTEADFVLVANCDDVTDINLSELNSLQENSICVVHPHLPFGRVVETAGYAVFEEKPLLDDWVSCGWYIFKKEDIVPFLLIKGSLEYDVFPKIKLRLYKHLGFWQPLNSKKDTVEFEKRQIPASLI